MFRLQIQQGDARSFPSWLSGLDSYFSDYRQGNYRNAVSVEPGSFGDQEELLQEARSPGLTTTD